MTPLSAGDAWAKLYRLVNQAQAAESQPHIDHLQAPRYGLVVRRGLAGDSSDLALAVGSRYAQVQQAGHGWADERMHHGARQVALEIFNED